MFCSGEVAHILFGKNCLIFGYEEVVYILFKKCCQSVSLTKLPMLYSEELPTSPKYPTTGVQIDSLCVPDANIAGKRESLPELEVKYHILMDSM